MEPARRSCAQRGSQRARDLALVIAEQLRETDDLSRFRRRRRALQDRRVHGVRAAVPGFTVELSWLASLLQPDWKVERLRHRTDATSNASVSRSRCASAKQRELPASSTNRSRSLGRPDGSSSHSSVESGVPPRIEPPDHERLDQDRCRSRRGPAPRRNAYDLVLVALVGVEDAALSPARRSDFVGDVDRLMFSWKHLDPLDPRRSRAHGRASASPRRSPATGPGGGALVEAAERTLVVQRPRVGRAGQDERVRGRRLDRVKWNALHLLRRQRRCERESLRSARGARA